eukprot:COSAG06_NODE_3404_length_5394_cov_6.648914_2_plen_55_part_00
MMFFQRQLERGAGALLTRLQRAGDDVGVDLARSRGDAALQDRRAVPAKTALFLK